MEMNTGTQKHFKRWLRDWNSNKQSLGLHSNRQSKGFSKYFQWINNVYIGSNYLLTHKALTKMHSLANATVLVFLGLAVDIQYSGASQRPRRCPALNCSVSDWSPWSSCNSSMSEHQGSESRSRSITTTPSCGGKVCPLNLQESRLCYGSTAQNIYSEGLYEEFCSFVKCGRNS